MLQKTKSGLRKSAALYLIGAKVSEEEISLLLLIAFQQLVDKLLRKSADKAASNPSANHFLDLFLFLPFFTNLVCSSAAFTLSLSGRASTRASPRSEIANFLPPKALS